MRTVCELVLNENYYLQPSITSLFDIDGSIVGKNALPATSASFERACEIVNTNIARTVLHLDCIATTKLGDWSNMFHIYGLASVLKTSITSVYPDVNKRIRQFSHRQVSPRISDNGERESIPFIIMWTHLSHIPSKNMQWSPNHFVPCFTKSVTKIYPPLTSIASSLSPLIGERQLTHPLSLKGNTISASSLSPLTGERQSTPPLSLNH